MAAGSGNYEILEKLWVWANELQLKPKELRNEVWLLEDNSGKTPLYRAAGSGKVEVIEKLWDLAKDL